MSRLLTALRPLFAAIPALSVLLWLLASTHASASGRAGRDLEAHISRGGARDPTPTPRQTSDAAELREPIEEDVDHDCDADERATSAEISTCHRVARTAAAAATTRPRPPTARACCIRGPPRPSAPAC